MRNRLTRWDCLGMVAGLLLTFAITGVLSRGRIFWEDEMLGWMLLRDPSWHHMLFAYNHGADGGGFSFYLLGRGWLKLFGPSELSFRLFSSTCFGLAFAVTWAAARRFYSVGVTAFALFNTWFFSPPFVAHMAEGRFYGLLVLGVSLAIWLALDLAETPARPSLTQGMAMFLVHGLLTTSHLLGVVFSAFLIAAMVASDLLATRQRPSLYLAGIASWLLLFPERANILASARVGKPWFWTKAPRPMEALSVYTGSSKEIALLLFVLLSFLLWSGLRGRPLLAKALRRAWSERTPVYLIASAMFLLGVAFLIEGLVGTWLFNDRYLLPMTVAVAYLTAELTQLCLENLAPHGSLEHLLSTPWVRYTAAVAFVATLLFWDFRHLAKFSPSPENYTAELTAKLPRGIPVVCEDAFTFTELLGRQHTSGVQYVYLLDWPQTVSQSAPRLEVTQYHLMENWREVGYFSGSIEPVKAFLRAHRQFVVLHAEPQPPTHLPPEIGNPLAERFTRDPAFKTALLARMDGDRKQYTAWLVCEGACAPLPLP